MHIVLHENSRNAAASQSPGLAAFFAGNPGNGSNDATNPEGLSAYASLSRLVSCKTSQMYKAEFWQ
jgi:hypothetical protein